MNIAPREIEELLVAFPEVDRAAVVGLADERLGETHVRLRRAAAGAAARPRTTVVERLTRSGPRHLQAAPAARGADALPTTASGKVQKHEIVRTLAP